MDISFDVIGKNMIITMEKELDHHNAEIVRNAADKYIYTNKITNIIFDFKKTIFMDSSGIGVILGRYKMVSTLGGKISVVNVRPEVERILLLSGLYKLIKKYESLEEALENENV
ncbi:MAG: anti-sigma F factor antagonist [Lachnospiraceae bacterium]|nr:anti-sigma F factor antagonist [Lachnospiraceae bacterium]